MKVSDYIVFIMLGAILFLINSCDTSLQPYDSKSSENALKNENSIQTATYGNYSVLKSPGYIRYFYQLNDYAGDNVVQSGADADEASLAASYEHTPNMYPTEFLWQKNYKLIYGANKIINKITEGKSNKLDQLKGENFYLRAMAYFNLVQMFGRPHTQDNGENLGVPIVKSTEGEKKNPPRSTVKEVYNFIISDLLKAEKLMTFDKNANYASKEVAEALLSRVYLYKGDNENAIEYANKVINSGRYSLLDTDTYKNYPTLVPENNSEAIFAIRLTKSDNRGKSSIGSMFYNDPETQSTGWGEYYASRELFDLLHEYSNDARLSFITPHYVDGELQYRGIAPQYYINKFNYQQGIVNLSSPLYIRLAEIYLNRAEAYAKIGDDQSAIKDVNLIRKRANIPKQGIYSVDDLKGQQSVLDVVLKERRLELAYEGHRYHDLFRNNRPVVINSPGENQGLRIEPTDDRVIFYIPEREMNVNPNLVQNP